MPSYEYSTYRWYPTSKCRLRVDDIMASGNFVNTFIRTNILLFFGRVAKLVHCATHQILQWYKTSEPTTDR